MDKGTLVEKQIEDGRLLIDRLRAEGVSVTAAAWIKESESGWWYLYLATPLVGPGGAKTPAYRRVNAVLREMAEPLWVEPLDIKVVGPDSPVGKALHELQQRYPGRYGGPTLGGLGIEGAYIYPATPAPVS